MANWYSYDGVGDPALPGSYYKMAVNPNCLSGGSIICAIYLDDTANVPSNISAVLTYIANAQATLVSQPPGADRRFVYVKNLTS
ncbi:hypothetical protein QG516_20430 [Pedobacter gandavensis]|uniref:hypothetical protein n=1 Tax=Pedobacter TaxID=84567 RepID=UPI001C991451|nr:MULTISPECIES: hypothetical protein [Pedobacter]WGQ08882.1 hypothetical protein QG516_20430 [Pedobacter gandavensis]